MAVLNFDFVTDADIETAVVSTKLTVTEVNDGISTLSKRKRERERERERDNRQG